MNDRELISALMDGELEGPDRDRAVDLLMHRPELAETWRRWQLVRSSLKHEASDTLDISRRVAARLADEPVVLAPAALWRTSRTRLAWGGALAASLTLGVGVWVWSSLQMPAPASGVELAALYNAAPQVTVVSEGAATAAARPAAAPVVAATKVLDDNQRENAYIVAHAEYAHRGLQTGLRNFARVAVADDNAEDLSGAAL